MADRQLGYADCRCQKCMSSEMESDKVDEREWASQTSSWFNLTRHRIIQVVNNKIPYIHSEMWQGNALEAGLGSGMHRGISATRVASITSTLQITTPFLIWFLQAI